MKGAAKVMFLLFLPLLVKELTFPDTNGNTSKKSC